MIGYNNDLDVDETNVTEYLTSLMSDIDKSWMLFTKNDNNPRMFYAQLKTDFPKTYEKRNVYHKEAI